MDGHKGKKWSRESLEIMIKVYQEHECLYDKKSPNYYNRQKNRNALEAILIKIKETRPQTSAAELKYKLKTLRIQFLQEHKKVQQSHKNGDDIYIPKVWWYEQLLFLRNFIEARLSKSNIPQVRQTTEEMYENILVQYLDESEDILMSPGSLKEELPIKVESSRENSRESSILNEVSCSKKITPQTPSAGVKSVQSAATETRTTVPSTLCQTQADHTWRTFGEFVGQSLAGIKTQLLAKQMKHDIMKVIMEGERNDDL